MPVMTFSPTLLAFAYVLHIGGGAIGLVSGTLAAFARKGARLHRAAGTIFFVSMLAMAVFAGALAVAVPGQSSNLLGAILTFYLVSTAWLTVRRKEGTTGTAEMVSLAASLLIALSLGLLGAAAIAGRVPALKGPLLPATLITGAIAAIAAIGDARVVLAGGTRGAARIARHLWRMLTALIFAFGSAFTNGLPRLLPGPLHVPPIFFAPMLLPLSLLLFWMVRVRMTGWMGKTGA